MRKKRAFREGLANGSYPTLCCRPRTVVEGDGCTAGVPGDTVATEGASRPTFRSIGLGVICL